MSRTAVLVSLALLAGCEYGSFHITGEIESPELSGDAGVPAMFGDAGPGMESLDAGAAEPEPELPDFASHDDPAVQATISAWRERYQVEGDVSSPDSARCIEAFLELRVITAEAAEFRRLCSRCDPDDPAPDCGDLGRANACAPMGRLHDDDGVLGEELQPLNVIASRFRPGTPVYERLVIHETIHHLGLCTGDGMDHWHRNEHYWCGSRGCGGARDSVDGRARDLLAHD